MHTLSQLQIIAKWLVIWTRYHESKSWTTLFAFHSQVYALGTGVHPVFTHTHTHTHTPIHAYKSPCTYIHINMDPHTYAYMHSHTNTVTRCLEFKSELRCSKPGKGYLLFHIHTNALWKYQHPPLAYIRTYIHVLAYIYIYTHMSIHSYMHT